jgi:hypothetical protein
MPPPSARARASSVSLDEAAELTDDTIDLSAEAEKADCAHW